MIVSIIGGTGPQGLGIGERLAIEGVDVIIGSRKEEKALTKVEETLELLKEYDDIKMVGMSNEDAAKEGDLLILTVPLAAQKATLQSIKEFVGEKYDPVVESRVAAVEAHYQDLFTEIDNPFNSLDTIESS